MPDASREAAGGGTTKPSVVPVDQRITVIKPRERSLEHGELELPTIGQHGFAGHCPFALADRRGVQAPLGRHRGQAARPDEPLSVWRRWVALTQAQLHEWLSASTKKLDLPGVMIDGIHFCDSASLAWQVVRPAGSVKADCVALGELAAGHSFLPARPFGRSYFAPRSWPCAHICRPPQVAKASPALAVRAFDHRAAGSAAWSGPWSPATTPAPASTRTLA